MLSKVNKADMAGIREGFEDYLRSPLSVEKALLAYIVIKMVVVQTLTIYCGM